MESNQIKSKQRKALQGNFFRAQAQNAFTPHGTLCKIKSGRCTSEFDERFARSKTFRLTAAASPKPVRAVGFQGRLPLNMCAVHPKSSIPAGHHPKIRRIERSWGRVAICCANFQKHRQQGCDHVSQLAFGQGASQACTPIAGPFSLIAPTKQGCTLQRLASCLTGATTQILHSL